MSLKAHYQTLYAYNGQTTQRLIDCAAQLDATVYLEQGVYGHGSIHDIFFHLLQAHHGWRIALETLQRGAGLPAEDFATLESISPALGQEAEAWDAYITGLSEADIEAEITLTDLRGNPRTFLLWRILQHLVLHGMQHHSELAQILTLKGQSPGNLDFIFYK
jgi:uncharacterized damage-inducible protein DinB